MANFVICYDVRVTNHDYKALYSALDAWGAKHLQNSVWLLSINGSARTIRDTLKNAMHQNDTLAVVQLPDTAPGNADWATSFDRHEGVDWLRQHYG